MHIYTENECSCPACQKMCKTSPCLGTPADILNIIMAGRGKGLSRTSWATGVVVGVHDSVVDMIQPRMEDHGCAFLDCNNLCTLHDLGLKPTEGKMAHHAEKMHDSFKNTINYQVAMTWIDENGANNAEQQLLKTAKKLNLHENN